MNEGKIIEIAEGAYFVPSYSVRTLTNPLPFSTYQCITDEDECTENDDNISDVPSELLSH